MRRATRWLDRELPSAFALADERGRDAFSFEPIVSAYLEAADEIVVRTPYSRTVVEELRAVPWAWWNGEDKAWHVPFRSIDELRRRWPEIEAAAQRSKPEARRHRREAANPHPNTKKRKQRQPSGDAAAIPFRQPNCRPDRVLMSHEGPLVVLEVTGKVVPAEIAHRHYPWSVAQPTDLIWALWRRPTHNELVKTWPARHPAAAGALLRGWWQPTLGELRVARRAARSVERARETRHRRGPSDERAV